jgi:hypothetical protein
MLNLDFCAISPKYDGRSVGIGDFGNPLHVPVKFLTPPGIQPMYLMIEKKGTQTPIKVRL